MSAVTKKYPRQALADLLERITQHVRRYECRVSMEFDGDQYRVSVSGDGTTSFAAPIDPDEEITLV